MAALSALDDASDWLNSEPLTAAGLEGRVVLVDIWTFSCVNWIRTLPYVAAWHAAYRNRGLAIVGVHAPEFGFEHDLGNVRHATAGFGVEYPVVIDNDFAIWRALDNHYWPAVYLFDGDGHLRFTHFGEEAYVETERAIQELLGVDGDTVSVAADGLAEAADWANVRTPETYVGAARGEGRVREVAGLNQWSLAGGWSLGSESAALDTAPGSITFRFHARDLNLVLTAEQPARVTVRLDGEPPGEDAGLDVDAAGAGTVDEPRMYQLVRQRTPRERTAEIAFDDPGVRAYVFTFG